MENTELESGEAEMKVEISGSYEGVMARLRQPESSRPPLEPLVHDVDRVLDTVDRMEAGTRSQVADRLADTNVDYDAESLVTLLQVLKQYDLVTLENNTWKPGPAVRR